MGGTPEAQTWEGILSPLVGPLIWEAAKPEQIPDSARAPLKFVFLFPDGPRKTTRLRSRN